MKKEYRIPETEIIEIKADDIITNSNDGEIDNNN